MSFVFEFIRLVGVVVLDGMVGNVFGLFDAREGGQVLLTNTQITKIHASELPTNWFSPSLSPIDKYSQINTAVHQEVQQ